MRDSDTYNYERISNFVLLYFLIKKRNVINY